MRLIVSVGGLLWVLGTFAEAQIDTGPIEARTVWERVIEAKGGRERLREIEVLLMTQPHPDSPDRFRYVDLWVFPDRWWRWMDDRGGYLGLTVSNFDGTGSWWAYEFDRDVLAPRGIEWTPLHPDFRNRLVEAQAMFLLETRWFQPDLLALDIRRNRGSDYYVITADVGERVEYYIDMETFLVSRVGPVADYGLIVVGTWDMEDYAPVDGIMMPARVESDYGATLRWRFAFNVDYDPDLFVRQPVPEDGPDGWERR